MVTGNFTGRLGLPNSRLGQIVPGAVSLSFGPGTFDFNVHQIAAKKIRVYYNDELTDSALNPAAYTLTSLAPPGTAVVPVITSVEFYDADHWSVFLNLATALTSGTSYSLGVAGVFSIAGDEILTGAKNFDANVIYPPIVMGAWQSKRGCFDILFDRSVGPTSAAAIFGLRGLTVPGPPPLPLIQLPWAAEGIPETTLRVQFPPGPLPPVSDVGFMIDFMGVADSSLNPTTDTVPLTLALRTVPPYTYANMLQLQIIDAYISDVSNDYINTGVIRIYFNGPTLDAGTETNWAAFQSGVHTAIDSVNVVTSVAVDMATLMVLANEFKNDFNAHIALDLVHVNPDSINTITALNAVDPGTTYILINEAQQKYINHLQQARVHLYDDTVNSYSYMDVTGNTPLAITRMTLLAAAYNAHILLDEYPLTFSMQYGPPMNTISVYSNYTIPNTTFETRGPYTLFADLRFIMQSNIPSVRLEATVTSEDGFSTTLPTNYTGSIVARPRGSGTARVQSVLSQPEESITIAFDREIVLSESVQINESTITNVHVTTSLSVSMWALNNIIKAYDIHLTWPPSIHRTPLNPIDFVAAGDYLVFTDIPNMCTAANDFKLKLNTHMTNEYVHWQGGDFDIVQAINATDAESLSFLIQDIRRVCIDHIARVGAHWVRGYRVVSAPIHDTMIIESPVMVNGQTYTITGTLQDTYHDNLLGDPPVSSNYGYVGTDFWHTFDFTTTYTGLAIRPSLASAIPQIGLVGTRSGVRLESDTVEAFFSKSMRQVPLSSTTISITGGSLLQQQAEWMSKDRATIQVISMEAATLYTVLSSGLYDEAGNLIY